ncbi:DEKNAAC101882 [Brettanomyces naardenensis]|uniref:Protoheme IX farnesyltransferase, mitochondrial n=1 Tax=Brettanomyces naardenensis TaxID=13370 RepID=A0A448YJ89_BRENA|nr:DEKNAAC101882 [Brettanomyces naardenensis]
MWKLTLPCSRLPLATNSTSCIRAASVRCFSYDSKVRKSANFYYANGVLNATKFGATFNKSGFQFSPNYKLRTGIRNSSSVNPNVATGEFSPSVSSTADSVKRRIEKADLSLCHPVPLESTSDARIPFQVKPKNPSKKETRSVVQQYLQGEKLTLKQIYDPYWALTKPHLSFLIMLSSTCSYVLAPGPTNVAAFLCLTVGTLMASGAANAINMGREPSFDKQMVRTASRPVVRGQITPNEAYQFAAITGTIGCAILYTGVNPTVAALGLLNIVLYSWVYTSLKRRSILNTWVGAVVGAIPPLMGWAACSSLADPGAWLLAALLYAWQFPHFNSLSHNIKTEYRNAGYVMTAFVNPKLNARVALRYSLLMFPICIGMSYFGVCDKYFVLDSSLLNGFLSYRSFMFWWQQHTNYSKATLANGGPTEEAIKKASIYARKTFWGSIWQLPVVLVLMMLHKSGQWDRFFHRDELADESDEIL